MTLRSVEYTSLGKFDYDDTQWEALRTDGQLDVAQAPVNPNNVLRLQDMEDLLLSDNDALPVDNDGAPGTGSSASRWDHIHEGVNLSTTQNIPVRKTFTTDLVCPKVIGGVASGSDLQLQSSEHATKGNINFGSSTYDEVSNLLGLKTTSPTDTLDINDDRFRIRTEFTPASATATGRKGTICWDASFIYVCVATDTWKRVAIATW